VLAKQDWPPAQAPDPVHAVWQLAPLHCTFCLHEFTPVQRIVLVLALVKTPALQEPLPPQLTLH